MRSITFLILIQLTCQSIAFSQQEKSVSVFFDIDNRSSFEKEKIDEFLRNNDATSVKIIGFADYLGSSAYNLQLSQDRAQNVAEYLHAKQFENLTIKTIEGKGEIVSQPVHNERGDASNRRVDLIFQLAEQPITENVPLKQRKIETPPERTDELAALEIDTTKTNNIVLEGVGFIPGRHYPLPESKDRLDQLLLTMKKYETLKIEIQGFICCDYSSFDGMDNDTQTMNLSENRAKFIYEFLIREGIDSERLSYKGYGSSKPKVFPEETEADRQANRRVEIRILK